MLLELLEGQKGSSRQKGRLFSISSVRFRYQIEYKISIESQISARRRLKAGKNQSDRSVASQSNYPPWAILRVLLISPNIIYIEIE